jgi:ADP-ribose pyrophosphatase YjhB (NUDIX family)
MYYKHILTMADYINSKDTKVSYGIACCSFNTKTNKWNIMIVKKRYTYCFCVFVFGQYNKKDTKRIKFLLNNMTQQEKIDILSMRFDILWYKIWLEFPDIPVTTKIKFDISTTDSIVNTWKLMHMKNSTNHNIPYNVDSLTKLNFYLKKKTKFESTFIGSNCVKLHNLMEGTTNIELSWEIPKGRKQLFESDLECANREFKEETGFDSSYYNIIFDVKPAKEIIINMGTRYIHNYYLAYTKERFKPSNVFKNSNNISEIESVKWADLDEIKFITYDGKLCKTASSIIKIMNSKMCSISV